MILDNTICMESLSSNFTTPHGVPNPSNHCYINALLQTTFCIFSHCKDCLDLIHNSKEGEILHIIKDCPVDGLPKILKLKEHLNRYDSIFSGNIQQDASEVFTKLCDIFHLGTRYSLLDDEFRDDSVVVSLTKTLFGFTKLSKFSCDTCGAHNILSINSTLFTIVPQHLCRISDLIGNSCRETITKTCYSCQSERIHTVNHDFIQEAKILVLLLNRFGQTENSFTKLHTNVVIEETVMIGSFVYELLGVIHHHGNTINSGHYTAIVKFDKYYNCNDNSINIINFEDFKISDSAYLLFYKLK